MRFLTTLILTVFYLTFANPLFAQEESLLSVGAEKGFVALSRGTSKYTGVNSSDATTSYFMVRPEGWGNISVGAVIYNSTFTNSSESESTSDIGTTETSIIIDNVQHVAYGTLLGYTWSSDSFMGLQLWASTGYMSNYMTLESNKIGVTRLLDGTTSFCQGSATGTTDSVYTIPFLLGAGITVNQFGFFMQKYWQASDPISGEVNMNQTCNTVGSTTDTATSVSDTRSFDMVSAFNMVTMGIHYRF